MSDEKGYTYRVGYLTDAEERNQLARPEEVLTILGDYTAPNAARAVHMALDDPDHGGVPSMAGQRMVAVPVSRWSEFGGSARQQTVWDVVPIEGDQATLDG